MEKLREKQEAEKKPKRIKPRRNLPKLSIPKEQPITVGSTVKIKGQSSVGEVLGINGKNAIAMFGMIKTNVKLDKLERSTPIQPTQKTMVKSTFSAVKHKIGYMKRN